MKKALIVTLVAAVALVACAALFAQAPAKESPKQVVTDEDILQMRQDIQSQRKQFVAANLPLTDDEAVKFWPVYDKYVAEMVKINDARFAVLKDYATNYKTLTDQQASAYITKWIEGDKALVELRLKYIPLVEKVLPLKKSAMFFQIDRRLEMLLELELSRGIPLVNAK